MVHVLETKEQTLTVKIGKKRDKQQNKFTFLEGARRRETIGILCSIIEYKVQS